MASDGYSLFTKLMEVLDDDELATVTFLARRIWLQRNSVIFEGVFISPASLVQTGLSSMDELCSTHTEIAPTGVGCPQSEKTLWRKPSVSVFKAN